MSKKENALAAIAAAVKQAELAYEFAPGSYTHSYGYLKRRREGPRRVFGGACMSKKEDLNESDDCERENSKGSFAIAGATSFPTISPGVRICGS